MSIETTHHVRVGFEFAEETIREIFSKYVDEISHMEKRYDPKTGTEIEPEKIIDQPARSVLVLDGREFEETDDELDIELFCEAVAKKARCTWYRHGNYCEGNYLIVFGPRFKTNKFGDIPVDQVIKNADRFGRIKQALKNLGLEPDKAMILGETDIS